MKDLQDLKKHLQYRIDEQTRKMYKGQQRRDFAACIESLAARAELDSLMNWCIAQQKREK